jgi:hypothetical protein
VTPGTFLNEHGLRKILDGVTFERSHLAAWGIRYEVCHAVLALPEGGRRPHLIGWHVRLAFERPDANTGEAGTGHSRPEFVGIGADETSVVKTCLLLAKLVAEHETCEAFHYRGRRVFDPHLSLDRLRAAGEGGAHGR